MSDWGSMGKITFILGGARSGKSTYALNLAQERGKKVAFIATGEPRDAEMKKRIALHKKERPSGWKTFEEQKNISSVLKKIGQEFDLVIIDCLTLLISNLILTGLKSDLIQNKINDLLNEVTKIKSNCIIVSNEVGLGIVPENKLARDFRDIAGRANQLVAKKSNQVFFIVSGIPWRIK